jgi:pantothenate synthetase
MRMMFSWTTPAAKGNQAIQDGSLMEVVENLLEQLQPEAAYFGPLDGKRAGMIVFDMTDPAQIPQIAEPLLQQLEAEVEFVPVMNLDDLRRALSGG